MGALRLRSPKACRCLGAGIALYGLSLAGCDTAPEAAPTTSATSDTLAVRTTPGSTIEQTIVATIDESAKSSSSASTIAPGPTLSSSTTAAVDDESRSVPMQTSYTLLTPSDDGLVVLDPDGSIADRIDVNADTMRALRDADQAGKHLILMDGISLLWVDLDARAVINTSQHSSLSPTGFAGVWVATADTTSSAPSELTWVLATDPDSTSPQWTLPVHHYPFAGTDDWVIAWDRTDQGLVVVDDSGSTKFAHGRPVAGTGSGATYVSDGSMWSYNVESATARELFTVGRYVPAASFESAEVWMDERTIALISKESEASTEGLIQVFDGETGQKRFESTVDGAQTVRWLNASTMLVAGNTIRPLMIDITTGDTSELGDPGQRLIPIVNVTG
jgi:hypothetical protein